MRDVCMFCGEEWASMQRWEVINCTHYENTLLKYSSIYFSDSFLLK